MDTNEEARHTILNNLDQDNRIVEDKHRRLISAAVAICWVVLGGVAAVVAPSFLNAIRLTGFSHPMLAPLMKIPIWGWLIIFAGIGLSPLQRQWHMPNWFIWTLLLTGCFIWICLILQGFIIPDFVSTPLVDR